LLNVVLQLPIKYIKIWRHFRISYPVVFLLNLVTQSSQIYSFFRPACR
jgi:hypothetical protein